MKSIEFTKILDNAEKDRLRIKITTNNGKITDIVVQYETIVNEKWLGVVRYDIAHGFFHRDVLNIKGEKIKTPIDITDLKVALHYAEQDLKDKWEFYKNKFLKPIKNDKNRNYK